MFSVQLQTSLFPRFPGACSTIIRIRRLSFPTWKGDMACPAIAYSSCAFDEERLGIPLLNPTLGEKALQAFLK